MARRVTRRCSASAASAAGTRCSAVRRRRTHRARLHRRRSAGRCPRRSSPSSPAPPYSRSAPAKRRIGIVICGPRMGHRPVLRRRPRIRRRAHRPGGRGLRERLAHGGDPRAASRWSRSCPSPPAFRRASFPSKLPRLGRVRPRRAQSAGAPGRRRLLRRPADRPRRARRPPPAMRGRYLRQGAARRAADERTFRRPCAPPSARTPSLAELAGRVNALLHASTPSNKYATAFLLSYDPATGDCAYVNGGHNDGIVLRQRRRASSCWRPPACPSDCSRAPITRKAGRARPGRPAAALLRRRD